MYFIIYRVILSMISMNIKDLAITSKMYRKVDILVL
jgi:hypothetical protein